MDVQPIDQGAVLRSGAATVPNYFEDQIRQQLAGAQVQQAQTEAQRVAAALSHQQREQQRQDAYQAALTNLGQNPSSQQLTSLILQFPEFGEDVNRARQGMDQEAQRTDRRQLAEIASAATAGHYDVAAQQWRQRVEADRAAGHETSPVEERVLADLESGDPTRQRAAAAAVGHLFAVTGTNFGEDLKALGLSSDHGFHEMQGLVLDDDGHPIAQDPRGHYIPGPNGSFYWQAPIPGIPFIGGGTGATSPSPPVQGSGPAAASPTPAAPSTSGLPRSGQPMPAGMFQGWQIIGVPGDPRRRAGGVEVPHQGVDFRPPSNNPHLVADRPLEIVATQPDHGISGITAIVRFPDGAEFNMMHLAAQPRTGHYDAGQVIATAGNTGNARSGSTQIHVQPWGGTQHDPRAYFGAGVGTTASPVRVRTRQQYDALPSGATYIPPDGSAPRTKP